MSKKLETSLPSPHLSPAFTVMSRFTAGVTGSLRKAVVSFRFSVLGLFSDEGWGTLAYLESIAVTALSGIFEIAVARAKQQVPPLRFASPLGMRSSSRDDNLS